MSPLSGGPGCPTGCGRPKPPGKLMCLTCWRHVPKHLQRDVYRTWRSWRADFGDAERMAAYEQAAEAAISAVP